MSTQFGWKKKTKTATSGIAAVAPAFGDSEEEDGDTTVKGTKNNDDDDVDWLTASKRKHGIYLEDGAMKSKRLKEEGNTLAGDGRFWEAIKYWNDALELTPHDSTLHEHKSQALSELGELFPAVQSAQEAVRADPTWYVARQRLGRAQMGLGEVEMAVTNFQKAVHLWPADEELWSEDLLWSYGILQHKQLATASGEKPSQLFLRKQAADSDSSSGESSEGNE